MNEWRRAERSGVATWNEQPVRSRSNIFCTGKHTLEVKPITERTDLDDGKLHSCCHCIGVIYK